mgnify:CR=1 FL=1
MVSLYYIYYIIIILCYYLLNCSEISRQDSHLLNLPLLRELRSRMDKLDQLASNGELDNESIYEFLHQIRNITREDLSK